MARSLASCVKTRLKREEPSNKIFSGQKKTLLIENVAIPLTEKFFREHIFRNGSTYNPFWSSLVEVFRRTGADPTSIFVTKTNDKRGFKSSTKVGGMLDYFNILQQYNREIPNDASANLEIDSDFAQIFVPFVNLKTSPMNYLVNYLQLLENVKKLFLYMHEISIGFPTETGFPFLFSYQSPKLLSYQETVYNRDFKADVNLFYSDRKQIRMGIVNPLNGKYYLYGFDVNRLINIPFVVSYKHYRNQELPHHIILEPLLKKDQRIIHLSTWEYLEAKDYFPVKPITEDKFNNFATSELVFVSRTHSDESARLRAEIVSPKPYGLNLHEFVKGEELKNYFSTGPLGPVISNSFDLYFKEDAVHDTSLILKQNDPSYQNFTSSVQNSPGILYEYKVGVEITGRTKRSADLVFRAEENDRKEIVNSTLQCSYSKDDTKVYESSFATAIQRGEGSSDDLRCGNKNYTIGVISELKFGKAGGNESYVSAEFDIHPHDYFENLNLDLNVKIDHDRLPKKYHDKVCNFKGGYYNFISVDYHLNVENKNSEKCKK